MTTCLIALVFYLATHCHFILRTLQNTENRYPPTIGLVYTLYCNYNDKGGNCRAGSEERRIKRT